MVWDQTSDFNNWDGITSLAYSSLIALDPGYTLEIKRIQYKGQEVQSVTLEIERMYEVDIIDWRVPTSQYTPNPDYSDYALAAFMVGTGIFMILWAWDARSPPPKRDWIIAIGFVLIIFGIFSPWAIGYLVNYLGNLISGVL